jgi:hypothetical protein
MMESFTMHRSYVNAMQCLPKSKHLTFLMMVIEYGLNGIEPDTNHELMPMFQLVKPNINESNRKRKILTEGRKSSKHSEDHKPNAHDNAHDNAQEYARRIGNGIGNGNGNGNENGIGIEEEGKGGVPSQEHTLQQSSSKRFVAPTVEEVDAYCRERGNEIKAQKFVDHYAAIGWMIGKTKMKDWKAAVRTWEQRDLERRQEGGQGLSVIEQYDPSKRTLKPLKPADAD